MRKQVLRTVGELKEAIRDNANIYMHGGDAWAMIDGWSSVVAIQSGNSITMFNDPSDDAPLLMALNGCDVSVYKLIPKSDMEDVFDFALGLNENEGQCIKYNPHSHHRHVEFDKDGNTIVDEFVPCEEVHTDFWSARMLTDGTFYVSKLELDPKNGTVCTMKKVESLKDVKRFVFNQIM